MKRIFNKIGLFVLLAALLSACDIDRAPKGSIPADQSIESVADAVNWDNGVMSSFRLRQRSLYDVTQDRMSDQLNAFVDYGNRGGNQHGWVALTSSDYDLRDVYRGYYAALKNVNELLANLPNITPADDSEKTILRHIEGNSRFARAFYYANLALRFGYRYNEATADKDLCVPLILEYDPVALPPRATNKQVYNQIMEDIKIAKEKLADVKGKPMADYFTVDACFALEARVKLYMKDYSGAYTAATKLIDSKVYPLIAPSHENLVKMWRNDTSSEEILQMYISRPDELPNTNGYYGASVSLAEKAKKKINVTDWLPTQSVIDLYDNSDLRKDVYFELTSTQQGDVIWDNIYVISKFKGNPLFATVDGASYWDPEFLPNGINAPKVFRVAEMYLIAAESANKIGDDTNAQKYLNALRASRGLTPVATSGDALFKEIQDERSRELAFEGFRLWDLRRWGMDMKRGTPQKLADGTSPFLSNTPPLDLEIKNSNYHFIWGIPANDMNTNPNLKGQQNPGW